MPAPSAPGNAGSGAGAESAEQGRRRGRKRRRKALTFMAQVDLTVQAGRTVRLSRVFSRIM